MRHHPPIVIKRKPINWKEIVTEICRIGGRSIDWRGIGGVEDGFDSRKRKADSKKDLSFSIFDHSISPPVLSPWSSFPYIRSTSVRTQYVRERQARACSESARESPSTYRHRRARVECAGDAMRHHRKRPGAAERLISSAPLLTEMLATPQHDILRRFQAPVQEHHV